ncbi:hypothetical protein HNY73_018443 [Argiope bruennichi]|uniref:Uncharacterized protein n=1 Tax=Argiope bruennichi TaxID=94029 RepID=A0A8T0EHV3_ARGBR|nr:hypothetical protein HNY73_018443 [Argiope bruennichi]
MRGESRKEVSSMSSTKSTSPTSSTRRIPIRRKKLPFSENITNSYDYYCPTCQRKQLRKPNTYKEAASLLLDSTSSLLKGTDCFICALGIRNSFKDIIAKEDERNGADCDKSVN